MSPHPHGRGTGESPVLRDTAAYLECSVVGTSDVGTHTIFVGRVIRAGSPGRAPLLHHDGRHATLA